MVVPSKTKDEYFRLCLTTNKADDHSCRNGAMLGVWPNLLTYTMCKGKFGAYARGASTTGQTVALVPYNWRRYSATYMLFTRGGKLFRYCAAMPTTGLYAKLFIYKRGSSIVEPKFVPDTAPP